ncbi:MAG: nucleotidyltransferase domain-containing protein [Terriglobales bacterium]
MSHSGATKSSLGVELQMLLAAAGAAPPPGVLAEQCASIDWQRLLAMARFHGLKLLLLQLLEQLPEGLVVGDVLDALRTSSRAIAVKNLALASELLRVSLQFQRRGIEHLAYKGPLLASALYPGLAMRVSNDLDILVRKSQVEAASGALFEIGYFDKSGFSAVQRSAAVRYGFEHTFRNPSGIDLDLHWRLVPAFVSPSLDDDLLFCRAVAGNLCGQSIMTFCPEDLLFVLCLHAGQHEWAQLSMFSDLARVCRLYPNLRWEIIRTHLADANTTRTILVSLCLLREHWKITLPGDIVSAIHADSQVREIADTVLAKFWSCRHPLSGDASFAWMLQRTKHEPGMARLRYIAGIALNPTEADYAAFRLPRQLAVLYPLLRSVRLAFKRGRLAPRHNVQND